MDRDFDIRVVYVRKNALLEEGVETEVIDEEWFPARLLVGNVITEEQFQKTFAHLHRELEYRVFTELPPDVFHLVTELREQSLETGHRYIPQSVLDNQQALEEYLNSLIKLSRHLPTSANTGHKNPCSWSK